MQKVRYFMFMIVLVWGLAACGQTAASSLPATPTLSLQASQGKELFTRECASCHSLLANTVIVGPSMNSIAQRAGSRVPNQDARTYLLASIIDPGSYLVAGFQDLMPASFGKRLTGEEIDALVAYLLTFE